MIECVTVTALDRDGIFSVLGTSQTRPLAKMFQPRGEFNKCGRIKTAKRSLKTGSAG